MDFKETIKKIINNYQNDYKRVPKRITVVNHFKYKGYEVTSKEVNRIYSELVKEGFLNWSGCGFVIGKNPPPVQRETKKEKPNEPLKVKNLSVIAIRVIMGFASLICISISIYYSSFWLSNFLPWAAAAFTATGLVLFGVIAPQAAHTAKNLILKIFLYSTMTIVILFSMISTVAGQYNKRSVNLEEVKKERKTENTNTALYKQLEKEIMDLETDLENNDKEMNIHIDNMKTTEQGTREYNIEVWSLNKLKKERKGMRDEKRDKESKLKNLIEKGAFKKKERQDFYTWVSSITGNPANVIEFSMSMFPAVIIDILAPLGLFIALGLYRKRNFE